MTEKTVNENQPEKQPEISPEAQLDLDVLDTMATEYEQSQVEDEAPESEAAAPQIETRELLAPLIHTGFSILCPNWEIEKSESGMLADAYAQVLDKYFPDGVQTKFGPEIAAVTCTAMIVLPRLKRPRKKPKPEKEGGKQKATESEIKADLQVSPEGVSNANF